MVPISLREWQFIQQCLLPVNFPPDGINIDELRGKVAEAIRRESGRELVNRAK